MLPSPLFAVATSKNPSPSKSDAATPMGCACGPMSIGVRGEKFPLPWPRNHRTVPLSRSATTRSTFPSPSKSPVARPEGAVPASNFEASRNAITIGVFGGGGVGVSLPLPGVSVGVSVSVGISVGVSVSVGRGVPVGVGVSVAIGVVPGRVGLGGLVFVGRGAPKARAPGAGNAASDSARGRSHPLSEFRSTYVSRGAGLTGQLRDDERRMSWALNISCVRRFFKWEVRRCQMQVEILPVFSGLSARHAQLPTIPGSFRRRSSKCARVRAAGSSKTKAKS